MEKQIDLAEIKEQFFSIEQNMCDGYQHEHILEAMKEACRQVLELAAENAKVNLKPINLYDSVWFVNKESILNTINQVI